MNLDEFTLPTPDRVFPPELERNIFEISALGVSLALGRFRGLSLSHDAFKSGTSFVHDITPPYPRLKLTILLRAIQNKPATFLRGAVRHLYIDNQITDFEKRTILAACTGITNLCAPTRLTAHQKYLENLPLKNIILRFELPISFTHSMFRHVTHLEVLEPPDGSEVPSPTGWATLPLIPHLTHFAFSSVNLAAILSPILITCARLECAIFHLQDTAAEVEVDAAWSANDVRFVTMREELDLPADWVHGAETGYDVWVRADALVAANRAAKVQHPHMNARDD
ncbi:hypothetical protein DFH09DRAFT_149991 [Mycena vulgaris]|nr:hypothetical protein DFH09DRAFT_149991 [Mycena vulgaris]